MIRVFVDASVLFAAAYSATGASRETIPRVIQGDIVLVISNLVFEEVKRNLQDRLPGAIAEFDLLLDAMEFELVQPSKDEIPLCL
jgi:predicted nucleic acid-binding protein